MRSEYWIQKAIKRKGALRSYVARKYGKRGFVKRGNRYIIKTEVLHRLAKKKGSVGKRARLALTLRRFRRRKR
ncbi:MAG: hypothetical protein QXQ50_07805 [Candidatus Bathyarchaeia archaeon]